MKVYSFSRLVVFVLLLFVVFSVLGCSESPESKAAKASAKSAEKAMLLLQIKGDYDKAVKEIKKAATLASKAGPAGEATLLVAGNFYFDYADQHQSKLIENSDAVSDIIDRLSTIAEKLSYLQIEKDHLESLMDSSDERMVQLEGLIVGSEHGDGIEKELAKVEQQLSQLQDEQGKFIAAERRAHEQTNELQDAANAKINASKKATGDRKQQLEKEHYELMLAKKKYLVESQTALDKVKEYQSQIAIVEPLMHKLQNDMTEVQRKIDDLEGSPQRSELKNQMRDAEGAIEATETRIGQLTNNIKSRQGEYEKNIEQIESLIDDALKNFKKIRSRGNRDISSIRMADSYYAKATTDLSAMEHYRNMDLRLQAISSSIDGRSAGSVDRLAMQYSGSANDHSKKAMEEYDNAIKEYQDLQKSAGRGRDELACSLTKSHILALLGKINLAEQLAKYELIENAADELNELVDKAAQCDPDFEESVTFKLFNGETEIVPAMSVEKEPAPAEKTQAKEPSGEPGL